MPVAVVTPPAAPAPGAKNQAMTTGIVVIGGLVLIGVLLGANSANFTFGFQLWGAYAVLVLFVIASAFAGQYWPIALVRGEDGRLSLSKAQVAIWTAAVAYSYVTLYAARAFLAKDIHAIDVIPNNVLLALGFSVVTAVGAKAITVNKIGTKQIQKTDKTTPPGLGDLVAGDDNRPDLTKVQLLFWTIVAVAVYLALTHSVLAHYFAAPCVPGKDCLALPDIDPVLMVLMGLSHGTYLGGKLTQADIPRITALAPLSGPPKTHVVVHGVDFGTVAGTVYLGSTAYWGTSPIAWDDTVIAFDWPEKDAGGNAWVVGTGVAITLVAGGQNAQGAASFTVTA
jgi:hypothetical protein